MVKTSKEGQLRKKERESKRAGGRGGAGGRGPLI